MGSFTHGPDVTCWITKMPVLNVVATGCCSRTGRHEQSSLAPRDLLQQFVWDRFVTELPPPNDMSGLK